MTSGKANLVERAHDLRRSFDRTFAEAVRTEVTELEDLLAIRVAGDPYAMRLREIAGLFADKRVTPLPSLVSELLGIAGFRGSLIPVFDLGTLLGYPRVGPPTRWLVLVAGEQRVGLAFDQFEGHLRLPSTDLVSEDNPASGRTRHLARMAQGARPLLVLASLLDTIKERTRARPENKEL